jgi:exonuclease SbcD
MGDAQGRSAAQLERRGPARADAVTMRILHTGDWHLGRTMRGQSRLPEFEKTLDEVAQIAIEERVDVMIVAGDTFDTFAPPPDAERLMYETLGRVLRDGVQIVMIAGNHDSVGRMDALSNILSMVGVHSIGSVPQQMPDAVLRVPSRDGSETATIVALPWVPERYAVEFEKLSAPAAEARGQYRDALARVIEDACTPFKADTINIFAGHMLLDGSTIGEGSGERKLHIGHNFAVNAQCFPATAQYVALGHVHKPQQIAAAAPTFYAGSLVQLDFGEGGQAKSVNIVDVKAKQPAQIRQAPITGGRGLRTLRIKYDDLASHGGKYGDDFLRVVVELERPVLSLYEQVRDVLPNAVDVTGERTDQPVELEQAPRHAGLTPQELLQRYYRKKENAEISDEMLKAFTELYEAELADASA